MNENLIKALYQKGFEYIPMPDVNLAVITKKDIEEIHKFRGYIAVITDGELKGFCRPLKKEKPVNIYLNLPSERLRKNF